MALVSWLPPQSVRRTAWRSGNTPHYYRDIVSQAGRNKSEFDRIEIQTQVKRTRVCEGPCVCGDDRQVTDTFNALSIRIEVAIPEPSLGRGAGLHQASHTRDRHAKQKEADSEDEGHTSPLM